MTLCADALSNNATFTFRYNNKSCDTLLIETTLLTRCLYEFDDDSNIATDCQSLIDYDMIQHSNPSIDTSSIIASNYDTVLSSPTNWIPLCYKYYDNTSCKDGSD